MVIQWLFHVSDPEFFLLLLWNFFVFLLFHVEQPAQLHQTTDGSQLVRLSKWSI